MIRTSFKEIGWANQSASRKARKINRKAKGKKGGLLYTQMTTRSDC